MIGRRVLLVQTARGILGIAVLGLGACTVVDESDRASIQGLSGSADGLAWRRVDLAYVSAYILVRHGVAAVVDTGWGGAADRIGTALAAAGSGWDRVRHVVVTHAHPDHFGSLEDVADRAAGASLHVGAPELAELRFSVPMPPGPQTVREATYASRLLPVTDDAEVLGMQVVATPGHTRGHIAVFDADTAVLVAGDALTNTVDGTLGGALAAVNWDQGKAEASVRKLAALEPRIILLGHGPPVERDAADKLRRLASSLG